MTSLDLHPAGGGCISNCFRVIVNKRFSYFLKQNSNSLYPALFQKESNGLEYLRRQNIIHVPQVISCTENEEIQLLLLEWIEPGLRSEQFWKQFGEELAKLHMVSNSHFGFEENNYMGPLPQDNTRSDDWCAFFIHHRLEPQTKIAREKKLLRAQHCNAFEKLYEKLGSIFNKEVPSLVHGDLWSGNFICNEQGKPVLIDPAVYFGHRGMDLAMTTLFGGFDEAFYKAYHYHFPFPPNHREQWEICNLYPLLIHLNIFGIGYLGQVESILRKYY